MNVLQNTLYFFLRVAAFLPLLVLAASDLPLLVLECDEPLVTFCPPCVDCSVFVFLPLLVDDVCAIVNDAENSESARMNNIFFIVECFKNDTFVCSENIVASQF